MEKINQKAIDILNNLLEINNARIEGYKYASKETNEADLKDLFTQFEKTSYECKQALTEAVKNLGGIPAGGTHTTRKFYRAWMDIKGALTTKDRKAILSSCEFGEDLAVRNYEDALEDNPLGSHLYSLIYSQYVVIKADHHKVKKFRSMLASMKV